MYRFALALAAPIAALFLSLAAASPSLALEAYLFRGAGDFSFLGKGLTFSNGMDRLGDKLEAAGVPTKVYRWEAIDWAYRDIMKSRPDSVMIMGHSMGALSTITLANRLKGSGIRVAYIGTIDIPGPAAVAPSNVEVAENFYHAFPVYGMLSGGPGFKGKLRNEYVLGHIHITMEKSKPVHQGALQFVAGYRGVDDTMRAYAAEMPRDDVIARVDSALAAPAAPSGPAPVAVSAGMTTFAVAGGETNARVSVQLPEIVPVPEPSPRRYATRTGLPPIQ